MSDSKFTIEEIHKLVKLRNDPEMEERFQANKGTNNHLWIEIALKVNPNINYIDVKRKYQRMLYLFKKYYKKEMETGTVNKNCLFYALMKEHVQISSLNYKEAIEISQENALINEKENSTQKKKQKRCAYKTTETQQFEEKIILPQCKLDNNKENEKQSDKTDIVKEKVKAIKNTRKPSRNLKVKTSENVKENGNACEDSVIISPVEKSIALNIPAIQINSSPKSINPLDSIANDISIIKNHFVELVEILKNMPKKE